jgi:hypothetical protein
LTDGAHSDLVIALAQSNETELEEKFHPWPPRRKGPAAGDESAGCEPKSHQEAAQWCVPWRKRHESFFDPSGGRVNAATVELPEVVIRKVLIEHRS